MSTETVPNPQATHDTLLAALEEARSELARARDDLAGTVRSFAIDRALSEAGVRDLVAARTLLAESPGEPGTTDPAAAVAALRTREPSLFPPRIRVAPGVSTSTPRAPADTAALQARAASDRAATGDRRALLDYMRLRRMAT